MTRIVSLQMEEGALCIHTRVHVQGRGVEQALAERLILDGISRAALQSPYETFGGSMGVRTHTALVERFSLTAVNVRVEDRKLVRRHGLMRVFNTVSRAYFGAQWVGPFKLIRFLLRFPDVVINLAGRDMTRDPAYQMQCCVVEHEFAHVWGCRDQYRYRNDAKRRPGVADGDIMYRTGPLQRLQPYHIEKLCACARRGKLPLRRI